MENRIYNYNKRIEYPPVSPYDKKEHLLLRNIKVLKIVPSGRYLITMYGLRSEKNATRVLLSDSRRDECSIIRICTENIIEYELSSISDYISLERMETYNNALEKGDYAYCISMLKEIEKNINDEYSKKEQENYLKKIKKKLMLR